MWPRTDLAADIHDLILDRGQRSFRTRSSTSRTLLGCAADLGVCGHLSCHANHATGIWIKHISCCRACLSARRLRRCKAHLFICTSGLGEGCFEIESRKEYIQRIKIEGCYLASRCCACSSCSKLLLSLGPRCDQGLGLRFRVLGPLTERAPCAIQITQTSKTDSRMRARCSCCCCCCCCCCCTEIVC